MERSVGGRGYVGRDLERTGSCSRKEDQYIYDASKRFLFFNVRAFDMFPALLLKPPCGSAGGCETDYRSESTE